MSDTLFDKIWDLHTVKQLDGENALIAIDRCYLHDLSGPSAMNMLVKNKKSPYMSNKLYAIPDHTLSSKPGRCAEDSPVSSKLYPLFMKLSKLFGVEAFDLQDFRQGIVYVVGPETGLSLPGMTITCGDSHTCTHGALGALAWGIGTSELYHVSATQTLKVKKPQTMQIELRGTLKDCVGPMDIMLYIISQYGVGCGIGYAVEYTGNVIRQMDMEQRMTLCNLTVELGSEYGLISPDEKTLAYNRRTRVRTKGNFDGSLAYTLCADCIW